MGKEMGDLIDAERLSSLELCGAGLQHPNSGKQDKQYNAQTGFPTNLSSKGRLCP